MWRNGIVYKIFATMNAAKPTSRLVCVVDALLQSHRSLQKQYSFFVSDVI